MGLENELGVSDKKFENALGVYFLGSATDLAATYYGIATEQIAEANPLISATMQNLGDMPGLVIPKAALFTMIAGATTYIHKKRTQGKTDFNPECMLRLGGVLTAAVGMSWVFDKYLF